MRNRRQRRRERKLVAAEVWSKRISLAGARLIAQGVQGPRLVELELAVDEALEALLAVVATDGFEASRELPEYVRFLAASRAFCEAAAECVEWGDGKVLLREGQA